MSTLPGPYPVPKDTITPYKVTFDRLMRTLSELQFQADILAENRAAGAVFDGVPFLLSMDSSERFLSIRAVWDTDFDAEKAGHPLFAAADSWNREKYFPTVYWMLDPAGSLQVCADFAVDTSAGLSDQQRSPTTWALAFQPELTQSATCKRLQPRPWVGSLRRRLPILLRPKPRPPLSPSRILSRVALPPLMTRPRVAPLIVAPLSGSDEFTL